ncbi:MAG: NADH-quinone oxidoreductase subunit G [Actinomycetota bacterium]|nr:NADH-quinone oxidoreductase subunit G [Actinomycetota bacterium]MDH4016711.1 NADH-quinone oxidoreductase subunit G [Actinomycetota bacterium]
MTVTSNPPAAPATPPDHVTVAIDDIDVLVPAGTLIIRAAEQVGIEIPRFCDHPLLEPVAACRACLIEIEGQPKPQPACAIPVSEGMRVRTANTSAMVATAQQGVMEFLLINHPLDCPVCDKGGECPLQNQAMSHGRGESRFTGTKRTFPKPVALSTQILLDRERCVSCARCTRFADQIAGDPFISLQQRGGRQVVGIAEDAPFNSYFSGNTIQICPVGALTSTAYRFRSRPFDLVSTPTVCEHCASGCSLRTDVRRSTVLRRLAWEDPEVNSDWNCDKGRFAFPYLSSHRLDSPLVRAGDELVDAAWPQAVRQAAESLTAAAGRVAVLLGGKLTLEDSYAYSKFARMVLGTDNIDFRIRRSSNAEADFLRAIVSGAGVGVTYADLDAAPSVLLVGLEPEEESPIIFLRLRAATRRGSLQVLSVAAYASPGSAKLSAHVIAAAPGQEPAVLRSLASGDGAAAGALAAQGSVILVGERAAQSPGTLAEVVALAEASGARLAWVPRRAGERGALEAGALSGLLPWGRPLNDPDARAQVAAAWGMDAADLPSEAGLDLAGVVEALTAAGAEGPTADSEDPVAEGEPAPADAEPVTDSAESEPAADVDADAGGDAAAPGASIGAVIVAGIDAVDIPDPQAFLAGLEGADFVLALETRTTPVTELADVVLPVGVITEKSGTLVDWEGRARPFGRVLPQTVAITDARALALVARAMGRSMGSIEVADLRTELAGMGRWQGPRPDADLAEEPAPAPGPDQVVLSTWRHLLDEGVLQRGEPNLAGTARPSLARTSAATAAGVGAVDGQPVTIASEAGRITLPLAVTDMVDGVVWVPGNSIGSAVNVDLGVGSGAAVRLSAGGAR